jgi:putative oxidoreductase
MSAIVAFVGRVMMAFLFVLAGINKLGGLAATDASFQSLGLPAHIALPTAVFEIVAGLAIALGIFTRVFALLLAGFCLATAVVAHNNFADPNQAGNFLKNVAIAGGFLVLFAQRNMIWSYDAMRERRTADRAVRDAELRAERAEGRLEGARDVRTPTNEV